MPLPFKGAVVLTALRMSLARAGFGVSSVAGMVIRKNPDHHNNKNNF
jgi:hypothetical protein